MAPTPARRVRRLGVLAVLAALAAAARELAFRRNDRLHPLDDPGRAP